MPDNPLTLDDLQEIPPSFHRILVDDNFLLYDSYEDKDDRYDGGRIIIFGRDEILRYFLFQCEYWFVDVTFRSSPAIFFQLFAIIGAVTQVSRKGPPQ